MPTLSLQHSPVSQGSHRANPGIYLNSVRDNLDNEVWISPICSGYILTEIGSANTELYHIITAAERPSCPPQLLIRPAPDFYMFMQIWHNYQTKNEMKETVNFYQPPTPKLLISVL